MLWEKSSCLKLAIPLSDTRLNQTLESFSTHAVLRIAQGDDGDRKDQSPELGSGRSHTDMDLLTQEIVLTEVIRQCNYVEIAVTQLNFALERLHRKMAEAFATAFKERAHTPIDFDKETKRDWAERAADLSVDRLKGSATEDRDIIFFFCQAVLVSAANLGKLFFFGASPSNPTPKQRRAIDRCNHLRTLLEVDDTAPFAARTVRNHFEHFDERLDEWAEKSQNRVFCDTNIASAGSITGLNPEDYMRNLDPAAMEIHFRGDKFELIPLVSSVQALRERALAQIRETVIQKHRQPRQPLSPEEIANLRHKTDRDFPKRVSEA